MIIVYIEHGLGNQMFQYAFGLTLAEKIGYDKVKYDISRLPDSISNRKTWDINDIFKSNFPMASKYELWKIVGFNPWIYNIMLEESKADVSFKPKRKKCKYLEEPTERWKITSKFVEKVNGIVWKTDKNYYVKGFWEDAAFFVGYEQLIQKKFSFKYVLSSSEKIKYADILCKNSVSIHVRRGDYLKQPRDINFNICNENYYNQAIAAIESKVAKPIYIFFSDDTKYVREQYSGIDNKLIIEGNKDYIDLQLMSLCKHNICANSTFSFWGAFLNKNEDKVVIVPKTHRVDKKGVWNKVNFPAVKGWIQIENYLEEK